MKRLGLMAAQLEKLPRLKTSKNILSLKMFDRETNNCKQ